MSFPQCPEAFARGTFPSAARIEVRGHLDNSRLRFERERQGVVAFLGGSITQNEGYRPRVHGLLEKRFPETAFTFINAGVASTCSDTGAFRLARDVLDPGPVDLLFVEFAVNDDQDGHFTREECIRGMEGIIRHARLKNPDIDIVIIFFANLGMIRALQAGKIPLTIEAHETVARRYEVPTVNLARELAEEITAGTNTWRQYGGVHPGPAGHALCAKMVDDLFDRCWDSPLTATGPVAYNVPPRLDPFSYDNGRFVDPRLARFRQGWRFDVPDWKSIPGEVRAQFRSIPMLTATEPGAELTLDLEGTAAGAYVLSGPDAGIVEASVDGGSARAVNLYTEHSEKLHYPRTVMFGSCLESGHHTLTLRMSPETRTTGHAMRILQFCAN